MLNGRFVTKLCDIHTFTAVPPEHFTGTCQIQSDLFILHLNVGPEAVRFQKRQKRHILSLAVAWFLQQRQCLVNSLLQIKMMSVLQSENISTCCLGTGRNFIKMEIKGRTKQTKVPSASLPPDQVIHTEHPGNLT